MNVVRLLNAAWMVSCQPERWAFHRAASNVAAAQRRLLADMLRVNADTEFGRRHGFARIRDPREYQRRVQLCTYNDCQRDIERIAAGVPNVLTGERVLLLQPTTGTTGGEKLIPYTRSLQRQYRRCVAAWIGDLFSRRPKIRRGRAYWSISPAFGEPRTTPGGLRIGFDDDAAYLGGWQQMAVRRVLAVPPDVARVTDIETFRYLTLWGLLAAEDLTLISIWSPTFLLALLDALPRWADRLAHDLQHGGVHPPRSTPDQLPTRLREWIAGGPPTNRRRRAAILRDVARAGFVSTDSVAQLWPRLALISCWTDAAASGFAIELGERLPRVEVQPKGLLATEGCVSFPLAGMDGAALAIRSHFLEFRPLDTNGSMDENTPCVLADELDVGARYCVVMTTGGGLYRYQLGDLVEVVGRYRRCPLVRFVGKLDRTSDLVGEKLAEPFVRQAVEEALACHGLRPRFVLLAPDETPRRYRLFLQLDAEQPIAAERLADELERRFAANPHYRYAVQLGQLAPVQVTRLDPAGESAWSVYERRCVAAGQKLGDIKPAILDARPDWLVRFDHLVQSADETTQRL